MNQENNHIDQDKKDNFSATLISNGGEHTVKKTDVNIDIDKDNPSARKIIIEKQVNVVHKSAESLSRCELKLLDETYRIVATAIRSIEYLDKDLSRDIRKELDIQMSAFKGIYSRAVDFMMEQGIEPAKINPIKKAFRWSQIKMSTLRKKSDSDIADMMIKGLTMGVTEIIAALNHCSQDRTKEPKAIAVELLEILRSSIKSMERYL